MIRELGTKDKEKMTIKLKRRKYNERKRKGSIRIEIKVQ
jgi:hypothetical protein